MNFTPLEFSIGGMHCAACSSRIERVLSELPEVASAGVSLATDTARVILAGNADVPETSCKIVAAVEKLGFTAEPLGTYSVAAAVPSALDRRGELAIGGMHCAACSSRIERVVGGMPGVKSITVSLASNTATLEFAEDVDGTSTLAAVIAAIGNLGFTAEPLEGGGDEAAAGSDLSDAARRWEKRSREQQEELAARKRDLIPAFAFALPLLVLSMGEMMGMPLPDFLSPRYHPFIFALAQLLLCLPSLIPKKDFLNSKFLRYSFISS